MSKPTYYDFVNTKPPNSKPKPKSQPISNPNLTNVTNYKTIKQRGDPIIEEIQNDLSLIVNDKEINKSLIKIKNIKTNEQLLKKQNAELIKSFEKFQKKLIELNSFEKRIKFKKINKIQRFAELIDQKIRILEITKKKIIENNS